MGRGAHLTPLPKLPIFPSPSYLSLPSLQSPFFRSFASSFLPFHVICCPCLPSPFRFHFPFHPFSAILIRSTFPQSSFYRSFALFSLPVHVIHFSCLSFPSLLPLPFHHVPAVLFSSNSLLFLKFPSLLFFRSFPSFSLSFHILPFPYLSFPFLLSFPLHQLLTIPFLPLQFP